jgi:hypothetical protein
MLLACAEFEFATFGIDPRREPLTPGEMSNLGDLLARKGDRCEICFEEWSDTCVADSPLLATWETCCTHFACRKCWGGLVKSRCPWCKWDIRVFLQETTATEALPIEPSGDIKPSGNDGPTVASKLVLEYMHRRQVGWIYAKFGEIAARFNYYQDHIRPCVRSGFCDRMNGERVDIRNITYNFNDQECSVWAVYATSSQTDSVLGKLAFLFGRVTKLRVEGDLLNIYYY